MRTSIDFGRSLGYEPHLGWDTSKGFCDEGCHLTMPHWIRICWTWYLWQAHLWTHWQQPEQGLSRTTRDNDHALINRAPSSSQIGTNLVMSALCRQCVKTKPWFCLSSHIIRAILPPGSWKACRGFTLALDGTFESREQNHGSKSRGCIRKLNLMPCPLPSSNGRQTVQPLRNLQMRFHTHQ